MASECLKPGLDVHTGRESAQLHRETLEQRRFGSKVRRGGVGEPRSADVRELGLLPARHEQPTGREIAKMSTKSAVRELGPEFAERELELGTTCGVVEPRERFSGFRKLLVAYVDTIHDKLRPVRDTPLELDEVVVAPDPLHFDSAPQHRRDNLRHVPSECNLASESRAGRQSREGRPARVRCRVTSRVD